MKQRRGAARRLPRDRDLGRVAAKGADLAPAVAFGPVGGAYPAATLGAPYVYNVQLRDAAAVVAAARKAVRLRFASYVPAAFSREAVVDRVCRSILEDVGPCLCATPGGAATDADCRNASLYTRTFFAAAPPGGGG